jgi:DNA-binding LytR/AlgR family response regulator
MTGSDMDTWRRFVVQAARGEMFLFDPEEIFYLEADGHDTLVRTAARKRYRSTERLAALAARLPSPPFFRCHESFVANLARVRKLERGARDWTLRLDPPVNKLLPVARGRLGALRRMLGVP